jgi:hypothetical protein
VPVYNIVEGREWRKLTPFCYKPRKGMLGAVRLPFLKLLMELHFIPALKDWVPMQKKG